jgi:transposase
VIVLGVDPHKDTHTVVAVDAVGQALGELTVRARTPGHERAMTWARALGGERLWAVEDCRHVSGRLERDLIAAGEAIVRVPPKLMAGRRRSARSYGKSDPIDAHAVARAALEHPHLPAAHLDEPAHDLKLLLDHREDLVEERTRIQNRLRWHLHELEPDLDVPARALDRTVCIERVARFLASCDASVRARICSEQVEQLRTLNRQINALESEVAGRVNAEAPQLLTLRGCGALTAAKLFTETAGAARFPTSARFAMYAGVAPIDCSSGRQQRHRFNPYGNRQLNAALHRVAITQARIHPPARELLARKQAEGKTKREAIRVLKHHLARRVYALLLESPH